MDQDADHAETYSTVAHVDHRTQSPTTRRTAGGRAGMLTYVRMTIPLGRSSYVRIYVHMYGRMDVWRCIVLIIRWSPGYAVVRVQPTLHVLTGGRGGGSQCVERVSGPAHEHQDTTHREHESDRDHHEGCVTFVVTDENVVVTRRGTHAVGTEDDGCYAEEDENHSKHDEISYTTPYIIE